MVLKGGKLTMDKEGLTKIVERVQMDANQFELLYVEIIKKVYFWCYTIVNNEELAKDLAQESMIRIYEKLHTLKNTDGIISWMYTLVQNVCKSHLRSQKHKDIFFLSSDEFTATYEQSIKEERRENLPNESYDLNETRKLIVQFVERLPQKQKEVIILFYLEEYKIDEIANILNYNVGSVKSRLHSGRKSLELQIEKYQKENNIKLYSTMILPLLGQLLLEYQDEVFSRQELPFEKQLYQTKKISKIEHSKVSISNILSILNPLVLTISITIVVGYIDQQINFEEPNQTEIVANQKEEIEEIYSNTENHPYIANIRHMSFPVKTLVKVHIDLKEDIAKEEIQIFIGKKEITFEKVDKSLLVSAKENGEYTIIIKDKQATFDINVIDPYAPELLEVKNYGEYLQLIIADEKNQINYEESYVQYKGATYKIADKLKVYGNFKGSLYVKIFTKDNRYIQYNIDLEN